MAHPPYGSGAKGTYPICPMLRRRYLAPLSSRYWKGSAGDGQRLAVPAGNRKPCRIASWRTCRMVRRKRDVSDGHLRCVAAILRRFCP